MDVIDRLAARGASIASAITAADEPGYLLVAGQPVTHPGELAQLRQLVDNETAIAVRAG